MAKSTMKNIGDAIGSATGKAWREAAGEAAKEPPRRSKGPLSGMRGVIVGAGLGVLAAKKAEPLLKGAMMKYVTSHAADQATNGASPATNGASPATDQATTGVGS